VFSRKFSNALCHVTALFFVHGVWPLKIWHAIYNAQNPFRLVFP